MRTQIGKLLAVALIALGMSYRADAADSLVLSYVTGNAIYWDLDVARDRGFFREEGFDPSFVALQSSPSGIQQVLAGAVTLSASSPEPSIDAYERGGTDLGIIAAPSAGVDWTLNVRPDIKSLADLNGKRIGVSAMKGGEPLLLRQLLSKAGLSPKDYTLIQIGVSPLKLSALNKGSIDAAPLLPPSGLVAANNGLPVIADFSEIPGYPYPVYNVSRKWAREDNRGKRVSRAIVRAQVWLHDPANKAEAIAIFRKYTKQSEDIAEKAYQLYFGPKGIFLKNGAVDLSGLRRLLTAMKEEGGLKGEIKAEKYVIAREYGGLYQ